MTTDSTSFDSDISQCTKRERSLSDQILSRRFLSNQTLLCRSLPDQILLYSTSFWSDFIINTRSCWSRTRVHQHFTENVSFLSISKNVKFQVFCSSSITSIILIFCQYSFSRLSFRYFTLSRTRVQSFFSDLDLEILRRESYVFLRSRSWNPRKKTSSDNIIFLWSRFRNPQKKISSRFNIVCFWSRSRNSQTKIASIQLDNSQICDFDAAYS